MSTLKVNSVLGKETGPPEFDEMPTVNGDPVVESGSNSDGDWTRWADGTMQQWKYAVKFDDPRGSSPRYYITNTGVTPFPQSFVDSEKVVVAGGPWSGGKTLNSEDGNNLGERAANLGALLFREIEAGQFQAFLLMSDGTTFTTGDYVYVYWVATGRWK